ncbi:MAG: CopD family protein [Roseiarcus sp.]
MKALHIVFMRAWMAALLYLDRLFVYNADARVGSELSDTLTVIERKPLKGIVNAAMAAMSLTGPLLAYRLEYWLSPWLPAKMALPFMVSAGHRYFAVLVSTFGKDGPCRRARFYRVVNEVPTGLMIAIVVLVAFKPF